MDNSQQSTDNRLPPDDIFNLFLFFFFDNGQPTSRYEGKSCFRYRFRFYNANIHKLFHSTKKGRFWYYFHLAQISVLTSLPI